MMVVGLTGGIGSGKTTVLKMFSDLGVPVYIADDEAKDLMNRSKIIKRKLIANFGKEAYDKDGKLNRDFLSKQVFNDRTLLTTINKIVHPKVAAHFKRWLKKQNEPYIIKEAAIIFEHSQQHNYDAIITVIADKEERINRLLERDGKKREDVLAIMKNQLSDEDKIKLSDYVIENNDIKSTKSQVEDIHQKLLKYCANSQF